MLVFVEEGKPGKRPWSKERIKNKLNSHMTLGQSQTHTTLVAGRCSQHCANHCTNPAPFCFNNFAIFNNAEFHATVIIMTNLGKKGNDFELRLPPAN